MSITWRVSRLCIPGNAASDLHNLLGDTNVLHVRAGPDGTIEYTNEIAGDTVADVLSFVEYDPREW